MPILSQIFSIFHFFFRNKRLIINHYFDPKIETNEENYSPEGIC